MLLLLFYSSHKKGFKFRCVIEKYSMSVSQNFKADQSLFFLFFHDTFFYSLVYDPTQKTLLADKGEIRVGPRFQADVPEMLQEGQCDLCLIFLQVLLFMQFYSNIYILCVCLFIVCPYLTGTIQFHVIINLFSFFHTYSLMQSSV